MEKINKYLDKQLVLLLNNNKNQDHPLIGKWMLDNKLDLLLVDIILMLKNHMILFLDIEKN